MGKDLLSEEQSERIRFAMHNRSWWLDLPTRKVECECVKVKVPPHKVWFLRTLWGFGLFNSTEWGHYWAEIKIYSWFNHMGCQKELPGLPAGHEFKGMCETFKRLPLVNHVRSSVLHALQCVSGCVGAYMQFQYCSLSFFTGGLWRFYLMIKKGNCILTLQLQTTEHRTKFQSIEYGHTYNWSFTINYSLIGFQSTRDS